MQPQTLRNTIGILIGLALATLAVPLIMSRGTRPVSAGTTAAMAMATQQLKMAQAEKFQSDMKFAESNAEAAQLVGKQVKLGRLAGNDRVLELNVRAGGVIEYLLDKKGDDGNPQRVIYLPQVGEPAGSQPIEWRCYSGNWSGVGAAWSDCTYDKTAWDLERRHVANLRASAEKSAGDVEKSRAKYESDRVRDDFERERAYRLREADRIRENEEREAARLEREAERAYLENERRKRGD